MALVKSLHAFFLNRLVLILAQRVVLMRDYALQVPNGRHCSLRTEGYVAGRIVKSSQRCSPNELLLKFFSRLTPAALFGPLIAAMLAAGSAFAELPTVTEFTVSSYNAPDIAQRAAGFLVSGDGSKPAGIYLRQQLSGNTKRVRINVSGNSLSGVTTLRFRIDGGEPIWLKAPEGQEP